MIRAGHTPQPGSRESGFGSPRPFTERNGSIGFTAEHQHRIVRRDLSPRGNRTLHGVLCGAALREARRQTAPDNRPAPLCSEEWKAEHKKQPIIKRYFSSGKHSRLLDTHRYLNISKVSLHAAMSMLSYLATALAHLKADDYAHMRIKLPSAKGNKAERKPEQQVAPGIVAALVLHQLNTLQQTA